MIKPKELNKISSKEGVRQQQIEKDYIISWVLWGISNNTLLKDVFYEFERKAEHKGHNPSEFIEKITGKKKTFENAWKDNLSHQIKKLSKFKDIWRNFNKQLRKLEKIK